MASKILFNGYSVIPLLNNGKKSFAVAITITGKGTGVLAVNYFGINNGAIFSNTGTVTLNNACNGSPTHYRASRYSDFNDSSWQTYSTSPEFQLYQIGLNRVYFQVKDATVTTEAIYREIGWHGQEMLSLTDTVTIGTVGVTDVVTVSKPVVTSSNLSDSVVIGTVTVTDGIVVRKNNVQVYP